MFVTRNVFLKYHSPDPGAAGGGNPPAPAPAGSPAPAPAGSPAPAPAPIPPELEPVIQQAVDNAIAGLKKKNSDLIAEKRQLAATLEKFDGIEPDAVREVLKRFGDEEEAGLIAKGKIDEVLNRRTERLNQDWQKKLDAEKNRASKIEEKANKLAARATADAIRAAGIKTGALPEAMEDIVLRAQGAGWTINDDGDVVAMRDGDIIFGKDGKTPLTPIEWAETLRETAPHLWPRAQGSGAQGSHNSGRAGQQIDSRLSPEARITLSRQTH